MAGNRGSAPGQSSGGPGSGQPPGNVRVAPGSPDLRTRSMLARHVLGLAAMTVLTGCPNLNWTTGHGLPPLVQISGPVTWPTGYRTARVPGRLSNSVSLERWDGGWIGEGTVDPDGKTYRVSARQDGIREGWHVVKMSDPRGGSILESLAWLTPSSPRQLVTLDATRTVVTAWVRNTNMNPLPAPEILAASGPDLKWVQPRVEDWERRLARWSQTQVTDLQAFPAILPAPETNP